MRDIQVIKKLIKGDRLRVSSVTVDGKPHLCVSLMDWCGFETQFYTDNQYIALPTNCCSNDIAKLDVELPAYYNIGRFTIKGYVVYSVQAIYTELNLEIPFLTNLTDLAEKFQKDFEEYLQEKNKKRFGE